MNGDHVNVITILLDHPLQQPFRVKDHSQLGPPIQLVWANCGIVDFLKGTEMDVVRRETLQLMGKAPDTIVSMGT